MKWSFIDLFIDQEIGALTLPPPVLASKAIDFNILWIEFSYPFIIELDPTIFRFLDIAEIVTKLGRSIMQDYSFQDILII